MKKGVSLPLIIVILASLSFTTFVLFRNLPKPQKAQEVPQIQLSQEAAIDKVKNLPEVKEYLGEIKNSIVDAQISEDQKDYLVHVYEIKNGHTATFNWFTVEKETGKITGQFESEQTNSEEFENYTNNTTGISIFYPPDWQIKKDTQIFENGDLATFQKNGPTQKASTDFNDGARLTIGNPFPEEKDAQTWAKDFYGSQKTTYSTEKLNVTSFVKVDTCAGAGCQTYYHAKKNNRIYSIFVFAQGEDKLQHQILLKQALNSLTF